MIDSDFTLPFLTLLTKRMFIVISVIGRCDSFVCAHGLNGGAVSVDIGRRSTARNQLVSRTSVQYPLLDFLYSAWCAVDLVGETLHGLSEE